MSQELREAIRADIGDDNEEQAPRFPDEKLDVFINTALKRLARRVELDITITDGELSRTPTSAEFDLIVLQTECLIATRERYSAIRKGVRVRQDENEVDTSVGLSPFLQAVSGEGGVCTLLEEAIKQTLSQNSGAALYGENIWHGNRKLYEDVDHDGQGSERIYGPRKDGHIRREGNSGIDGDGYGFTGRYTEDS